MSFKCYFRGSWDVMRADQNTYFPSPHRSELQSVAATQKVGTILLCLSVSEHTGLCAVFNAVQISTRCVCEFVHASVWVHIDDTGTMSTPTGAGSLSI